jgi:hypothetical protein
MKVENKAHTPPLAPKPREVPPQKAPVEAPAPPARTPEHLGKSVDVKA